MNSYNVRNEYKSLEVNDLQEICISDSRPFRVCALNITGDLNVGVLLRSASLLGAEHAYVLGRRKIDNRSLVGVQNYLPITKISALDKNDQLDVSLCIEFFEKMKDEGYAIVMVEQGGVELQDVVWFKPSLIKYLFVFGNEGSGIPEEILAAADHITSIPQVGVSRSFNVSAAANIVLWDYVKEVFYDRKD